MAETTGGLPTEKDDTEVPVRGTTKVGKYVFPTASGDTKLSNSILQQMEELYQKKLQEGRGLLSGLKDAAALSMAARPGGSSAYLQQREQQKADRAAELFNIRAQMAQYKSAQEAQERFETERGELLGTKPPAEGVAPTATAGGVGIDLTSEEKLALSRARTREDFNKLLNSFVTERTRARLQPSTQEAKYEVQYYDDNGNVVFDTVDLPTKQRLERSGRLVDISAPRTAPKAAAPAPAAKPPATQPPATQPPATQPPATQPPAAKKMSGKYLFEDISPDMLAGIEKFIQSRDPDFNVSRLSSPAAKETFNAMPLDRRKLLFDRIAEEQPAMKLASAELPAPLEKPVAPEVLAAEPTQVAQARPIPSIREMRAQQEVEKATEIKRIEALKEEDSKKIISADSAASTADDRIIKMNRMQALVNSAPELYGLSDKPGASGALIGAAMTGIKIGANGQLAMPGVEDMVRKMSPDLRRKYPDNRVFQEKLAEVKEVASYLHEVELAASQAYKGQGQVSDYERKIVAAIAGSTSDPAKLIALKARWYAMKAQNDKELGSVMDAIRRDKGDYVSFATIKRDPRYQSMLKTQRERANSFFPNEVLKRAESVDLNNLPAGGPPPAAATQRPSTGRFTPNTSLRDKYIK